MNRRPPVVFTGLVAATVLSAAVAGSAIGATATRLGPDGGSVDRLISLPRVLLAGNDGDPDIGGIGGNVWASYNRGASWVVATNAQARVVGALDSFHSDPESRHDPRYRNIVYTVDTYTTGNPLVSVSTDGGRHFATRGRIPTPSDDEAFAMMTVVPTRPRATLLVSIDKSFATPRGPSELWRSVDAGRTWRRVTTLPADVNAMWSSPTRPRAVFASVDSQQGWAKLYRSRDAGKTWARIGGQLPRAPAEGDLAISPRRPGHLLVRSNHSIFSSVDSGSTWVRRAIAPDLSQIIFDTSSDTTAYAASPTGVLRSTDDGRTWTAVNRGRRALDVTDLAATGPLLAVTSRTTPQLSFSRDGGETWTSPTLDRPTRNEGISRVVVDATDPNRIAVIGSDMVQSVDAGISWQSTGITAEVLAQDRSSDAVYAVAQGSLLRSPRIGEPFSVVSSSLPFTQNLAIGGNSIYLRPQPGSKRLRRSLDGGATWSWTSSLPFDVEMVEVAPSAPREVYAFLNWDKGYVWRSRDGGTTWQKPAMSGFPRSVGISALTVDRLDPSHLFAGANAGGVWTSHDRGDTWSRLTSFPYGIRRISQDQSAPTRLFVATAGFGAWRIDGAN